MAKSNVVKPAEAQEVQAEEVEVEEIKVEDIKVLPPEIAEKVNREISAAVVAVNYTDEFIRKMKEEFLPMTINGQEDKEGYLNLQAVRKQVKKVRIMIQNTFKRGRKIAQLEVKEWISKENEIVGQVSEVEDAMWDKEKAYETERDRVKAEYLTKIEQQGIARITDMVKFGAKMVGSNWELGDVSYEIQLIKEADPEIYEVMRDEFEAQFKINEKARLDQEEQQRQQTMQLQQQQEQIRKQTEELEAQRKEIRDGLTERRKGQMIEIGFALDKEGKTFAAYGVYRPFGIVLASLNAPQSEWDDFLKEMAGLIARAKVESERIQAEEDAAKEEKRLEGLENARKEAVGSTRRQALVAVKGHYGGNNIDLGGLNDEDWTLIYNAAKKANDDDIAETARKAKEDEDAKKGDKEKWGDWLKVLREYPVPSMRSGQYSAKAKAAREKIAQIQSL